MTIPSRAMPRSPEAQFQIRKAERRLAERERHRDKLRAAARKAADYLVTDLGAAHAGVTMNLAAFDAFLGRLIAEVEAAD